MEGVPSLVSLCMGVVRTELIFGHDDIFPHVYQLPQELFDPLVERLPPLALQKLQSEMPLKNYDGNDLSSDEVKIGRKHVRNGIFDKTWKALFNFRWPNREECSQPVDWQQKYWETHVQKCLDEAAKVAWFTSFSGCLGDTLILESEKLYIGCMNDMSHPASYFLKLSYHCQTFGCYVRCLTLQNVLCVPESCQLLRNSNLQSLVVKQAGALEYIDGLQKLLNQNSRTLTSLEFQVCNITSSFMDAICGSFFMSGHQIQHFSISSSIFYEMDPVFLGPSLASFLSLGRSSLSLKLRDNRLDWNFARIIFSALLDASSSLTSLDLSRNNITGWLSNFNWRSGVAKPLQSLRILNLGNCNLQKDDAGNLRYALDQIPSLEILDLSYNPMKDDGLRSLIPYLAEASPLTDLNLENCKLSSYGVAELLDALSTLARPMNYLSLAHNVLGSHVAEALGKFWGTSVRILNLQGIGMGPSGFLKLEDTITENLKLVELNISKNCGRMEAAYFLHKLIVHAPKLVAVKAAYNLIPEESLPLIYAALRTTKGHLEKVDLRGNLLGINPSLDAMLAEFQHNGKSILVISDEPDDYDYDGSDDDDDDTSDDDDDVGDDDADDDVNVDDVDVGVTDDYDDANADVDARDDVDTGDDD